MKTVKKKTTIVKTLVKCASSFIPAVASSPKSVYFVKVRPPIEKRQQKHDLYPLSYITNDLPLVTSLLVSPQTSNDAIKSTDASPPVEFGCIAGDGLNNMALVLKEVFVPLVSAPSTSSAPSAKSNEFKANVQKFESQISHAILQVSGDVKLDIPDVEINDPSEHLEDYGLLRQVEDALDGWSKVRGWGEE